MDLSPVYKSRARYLDCGADDFYAVKTAAFYFSRLLPRTLSLEASIRVGSAPLFELSA